MSTQPQPSCRSEYRLPRGSLRWLILGLLCLSTAINQAGYAPVFWAVGTLALVACLSLFLLVGRAERINEK